MNHIEYYEADDGTRFWTEAECLDYEISLVVKDINKYLKIYDVNFNNIEIGKVYDTTWQYKAHYYIIYDSRAFDFLEKCTDTVDIAHPAEWTVDTYPAILEFEDVDDFNDVKAEYEHYSNVYNKLIEEV